MRRGMCAPWCGRPPVRYAICCHEHWLTLDNYGRDVIRASYRAHNGRAAYLMELTREVAQLRADKAWELARG